MEVYILQDALQPWPPPFRWQHQCFFVTNFIVLGQLCKGFGGTLQTYLKEETQEPTRPLKHLFN